jgi:hypothetical protein
MWRTRQSAPSSTTICWRSITPKRACWSSTPGRGIAEREPYRESVEQLRCSRGTDTLTPMLILAEWHDFRRFASRRRPRAQKMAPHIPSDADVAIG